VQHFLVDSQLPPTSAGTRVRRGTLLLAIGHTPLLVAHSSWGTLRVLCLSIPAGVAKMCSVADVGSIDG
jgi:hypothetical protein